MNKVLISGLWYSGSSAVCDLLRQHSKVQMMPDNTTEGLPEFHAYSLGWVDEIIKAIDTSPQKKLDTLKENLIRSTVINSFSNTDMLPEIFQEQIKYIGVDLLQKTSYLFDVNNKSKNKSELFSDHFRNYIDSISKIHNNKEKTHLVFDQAIANYSDKETWQKLFTKSKLIIVERNILDQIADCQKHSTFFWIVKGFTSAKDFVIDQEKQRKQLYEKYKGDKNVFFLRFEDLIKNYQDTKLKILNFLDLDANNLTLEGKHLDPSKSLKNIGKYKDFLTEAEIDSARSALVDCQYCYDLEESKVSSEMDRLKMMRSLLKKQ
ncbi:sulfotransferase [Marinospirillum insulare]|uniref:Sulfotransferase family protein n=1 Tax=Marinospirillum insulare TaxID=217169 RepID=A0ABQ5ZUE8_9GAMM|nr:sulfotransferase [Marinospirillum insulare]GLR63056.1 hypothetical protein GCM10007878_04910 [Marinospirillum insulare]